jgi:predicted secreted protein
MFKRIAAGLVAGLVAALAVSGHAQAADAFALKVLGFSPDGTRFAFVQYAPRWDASTLNAELGVIDADRDRHVAGSPVRASAEMPDDATEDNIGPALKAFVTRTEKRAAGLLDRHKIARPGTALMQVPEARVGEYGSGSDKPGVGAAAVTARHPRLGELKLTLETKELPWPKTSRFGRHKEAEPCATAVDWQKGAGYRLTLEQGGRSVTLNDDATIPASRHCAMGYGIAEVHAFDRPDGKVTLAVIIGMHSRGFEGEDRTFLAVTRVLER